VLGNQSSNRRPVRHPDRSSNDTAFRYLAINAIIAPAFAILVGVVLLLTDTLGVRSLIFSSPDWATTALIFLVSSITTIVSLFICTAIAILGNKDV
jgi:hypothetical protein